MSRGARIISAALLLSGHVSTGVGPGAAKCKNSKTLCRPFRVAGAAALAPWIDGRLKAAQEKFGIPYFIAFLAAVFAVAAPCLSVVGLLFLSRRI